MYKITVDKNNDNFNKTFKGVLLKKVDVVENLEDYFKKTKLKEADLIKLLNEDEDIKLEKIETKETTKKVEEKKETPKKKVTK